MRSISISLSLTLLLCACGADEPEATYQSPEWLPEVGDGVEPVRPAGKADEARAGGFDGYDDPARIDPDFERRYAALPTDGAADTVPWTDTYWPRKDGGISYRWQTEEAHTYASPSREEAFAMSAEALALLSPSEKYDLLVGDYRYPLTLRAKARNQPTEAAWTGYCHGWTPASMHFDEPKPVVVANPDGLQIPFGSSDVKALLTYFQGEVVRTLFSAAELPFKTETVTIGTMCASGRPTDLSCQDPNPGAFHIVMANMLGEGQAFGIDVDPGPQKWNQPVHGFQTTELARRPPSPGAASDAVEEVLVSTTITYTVEIHATWEAVGGTEGHTDDTKTYTYTLELDAQGAIVGGQWLTVLEGGETMSAQEVYDYFLEQGVEAGQAAQATWRYVPLPDYVWYQPRGEFAEVFVPADSGYSFLVNTTTTRRALHGYFAQVAALYEAAR